ncbi:hypothetical protein, partial [Xanthomonas oryzae]|uniref:hypothetical protein n=2 Tax=Xanthomonas oryzae TaxID=347 RepID=UPI001CA59DE9
MKAKHLRYVTKAAPDQGYRTGADAAARENVSASFCIDWLYARPSTRFTKRQPSSDAKVDLISTIFQHS